MVFKIAVLASTRGTDLQAIIDEKVAGKLEGVEISGVFSNVKDCGALEKAKVAGIRSVFVDSKDKTREEFDLNLIEAIGEVDLICLIGYMRILTPEFIKKYAGKIINVHPALLPKYGGKGFYGKNVHESVLKNSEKESGMTIHYVTEEVDAGEILIQEKVTIVDGETAESLKGKVQALEKKYYPEAIRMIYNQTR